MSLTSRRGHNPQATAAADHAERRFTGPNKTIAISPLKPHGGG